MNATDIPTGAERVLLVLATLARQAAGVSVAQLGELTALPQSTLYRQLALLRRWGFAAERNGAYALGPMCMQMAHGFDEVAHLAQIARPVMHKLAATSGETVGLLVATRGQAVCVEMAESRHPLRCSFVKGAGIPLRRGASALALLAFLPAPQLREELDDLGRHDAALRATLDETLAAVRAAGHAVSDSQVDAGVWGVSAPLFVRERVAAGVLTLMAPSSRAAPRQSELIALTVDAARAVSSRLSEPDISR